MFRFLIGGLHSHDSTLGLVRPNGPSLTHTTLVQGIGFLTQAQLSTSPFSRRTAVDSVMSTRFPQTRATMLSKPKWSQLFVGSGTVSIIDATLACRSARSAMALIRRTIPLFSVLMLRNADALK